MKITSTANPRVKAAAKLRNPRQRAQQGRFLIDGVREISRALDGHFNLPEVYICREECHGPECEQLLQRLASTTAAHFEVSPAVFSVLAYGSRAEGVLAVAETPQRDLQDLRLPNDALVAVLENVEKPGNLGAVLRSADGAGVSAVIAAGGGVDLYNPNVIRASLGAIFTLPVFAAETAETISWLRSNGLKIFAARVDAAKDYTTCDFTGPCALVLGSEAAGLSAAWRSESKTADSKDGDSKAGDITAIRLPMLGAADSLNVSTTAAILFYEALRQRS